MVDFKSIETFLWVVTLGSFRGAGQRLNTTQPAISQRIAQLEREMGVKLLNRDHRVVSPTPSGRQLMLYAEKLIGLSAEMMAEVGDRSAMRGVLRLGVAETIVHTWLSRLDQERQHSLSQPVAGDRGRHHAQPDRAPARPGNRTRLAARAAPGLRRPQPRVVRLSDRISGKPIAWPPAHPLKVKDLAKFPIITFPRKTQPYETVRSLFNQPDLPPIRLHASASLATVIHMAVEGLGIAVIPTAIVENELADGRLQLLSTDLKIPPLTFSASWLESPDTLAVERVADLAAKIAQGRPRCEPSIVDAPGGRALVRDVDRATPRVAACQS